MYIIKTKTILHPPDLSAFWGSKNFMAYYTPTNMAPTCKVLIYVFVFNFDRFDLEMEFKPMSKKIASAKLGVKIKCDFVKEGCSE